MRAAAARQWARVRAFVTAPWSANPRAGHRPDRRQRPDHHRCRLLRPVVGRPEARPPRRLPAAVVPAGRHDRPQRMGGGAGAVARADPRRDRAVDVLACGQHRVASEQPAAVPARLRPQRPHLPSCRPLTSADVLMYAAYGRLQVLGLNPYNITPAEIFRSEFDPVLVWTERPWQDTPSVYGPLASGSQWLAAWLGDGNMHNTVFWLQMFALVPFLLIGAVIVLLAHDDHKIQTRAVLFTVLNPIMIWSVLAGAHNEAFTLVFAIVALLVHAAQPVRRRAVHRPGRHGEGLAGVLRHRHGLGLPARLAQAGATGPRRGRAARDRLRDDDAVGPARCEPEHRLHLRRLLGALAGDGARLGDRRLRRARLHRLGRLGDDGDRRLDAVPRPAVAARARATPRTTSPDATRSPSPSGRRPSSPRPGWSPRRTRSAGTT